VAPSIEKRTIGRDCCGKQTICGTESPRTIDGEGTIINQASNRTSLHRYGIVLDQPLSVLFCIEQFKGYNIDNSIKSRTNERVIRVLINSNASLGLRKNMRRKVQ
jgi:hypothetical protein